MFSEFMTYKEWSKEKVKTRTTRSKSRTHEAEQERKRDTLRRVLTKSIFCCGIFCQIVYILTEFQMSRSLLNFRIVFIG
ncbi:hypothetical protein T11_17738 [Trichinella zimbabwensis]|uniref:Uncharacterized protein n=1 Tax=Trichinella zimbabwensis TaxID=268475 RepID=A0A0V1H512_9BILA|nr:hypothetical protein T11_17738 [Trichinella zimbabwensis]